MAAKEKMETPPSLDIVIRDLVQRRTQLDKLDDKLSGLIKSIESVLRLQVSTRISRVIGDDDGHVRCLTFGKLDGKFMLLLETGYEERGEFVTQNETPLLSTSRETRTFVFAEGHVEQLLRSAYEQFSEQIAMRKKALAAAELIANALGPFGAIDDSPPAPDFTSSNDDLPF